MSAILGAVGYYMGRKIPPEVPGTPWEGGYYVTQMMLNGKRYALVVAPRSAGQTFQISWKTSNSGTPAADRFDGYAATQTMNDGNHPAAGFCAGLTIDGYSDWYLPSGNELLACYQYLKPTTTATTVGGNSSISMSLLLPPVGVWTSGDRPTQTSSALFISGGSEAFPTTAHWTSHQNEAYSDVALVTFSNGNVTFTPERTSTGFVRAVRRVLL